MTQLFDDFLFPKMLLTNLYFVCVSVIIHNCDIEKFEPSCWVMGMSPCPAPLSLFACLSCYSIFILFTHTNKETKTKEECIFLNATFSSLLALSFWASREFQIWKQIFIKNKWPIKWTECQDITNVLMSFKNSLLTRQR